MILNVPNITLSKEDQKTIAVDLLFRFSDWERNFYVENNQVFRTIIGHTTHSFEIEEFVREATDKDRKIWAALQLIRSM